MRFLLCCVAVAAAAAAQSATVSNTANAGAGTLRAALTSANASAAATFLIDIAAGGTAGPIVLASILPSLTKSNVLIRALGGAGTLIVDARAPTASGGFALELIGNNIDVQAPCRMLVQQGHGVIVRGAQARFANLECVGTVGANGLLVLAGADDLVIGRFFSDGFQTGIRLQSCSRARIADDGMSTAEIRNGIAPGISIAGGSDHTIGSFLCTANELGVSAANCPRLLLGRGGNPRSLVSGSRQQGILLQQCSAAMVHNVDLLGNGTATGGHGLQVIGGAGLLVSDVRAEANVSGGVRFEGGMSNVRIGPNVSTRGIPGMQDIGLTVGGASAVTIVDCTFGPDHRIGAMLAPDGIGMPADVTLCRCLITGNRAVGLSVLRSSNALVCSSAIALNTGDGIEAVGATLATAPRKLVVANCIVSSNAGNGVLAQTVDGLQVGPGNRIDDNVLGGLQVFGGANSVVSDNLSIDRNRDGGIWLQNSVNAIVVRSSLRDNRRAGVYALHCSGLSIGPDVAVHDTVGTGVQLEGSDGCRVFSSQISASTAHGVHVVAALGFPGIAPHLLQSCLIADHPGLALFHSSGLPVVCEMCTIAGNLRGVYAGTNSTTIDSCIVYANVLEDLQQTATALTVRNTFHQVPAPTSGSTNTNANPLFVSSAMGDWRLQSASPAVGFANQAIAVAPGALDAYSGPRVVGALDSGAYEVGPHPGSTGTRLLLSSSTMSNGGGGLAFHVQYPATTTGMFSFLLMELGAPSGSFPAFGAVIPLALTPALLLAVEDTLSVGTVAPVGVGGLVAGALLWAGRIPTSAQNQAVSLCAVALDLTPTIRAVSNVATFTIL